MKAVLPASLRRKSFGNYSYSEDQKRREKRDRERRKMPPVQADSLSALMRIADEPPRGLDPDAGTCPAGSGKPLVLYVVRVPGSQDLFLTTMHPAHSTVTAEDINACLYYVHIHVPAPPTSSKDAPHRPIGLPPPPPERRSRWSASLHRHKESLPPLPTMTIVRRDPASGAQWNVAQVGASPLPWSSALGNSEDRVLLEILTEGYAKFLPTTRAPIPPPATAFAPPIGGEDSAWGGFGHTFAQGEPAAWEARQSVRPEIAGLGLGGARGECFQDEDDRVFRREMWIEGVGFWNRVKHMGGHHRKSKSQDAIGEKEKENEKEKVKKRGYVFDACWGDEKGRGRCEFKDEGAGKILKCKYYPPTPTATHKSSLLSVIEFKPPSTTVVSTRSLSRRRSTVSSQKSSRSPSPGDHSLHRSGINDEIVTSAKAKLATMVVHSNGILMLDLLVAANIAVFWRRWEGWSKERAALGAV